MYSSVGTLGGEWRGLSIPMARFDGREVAKDYGGKCTSDDSTKHILLRMTVVEWPKNTAIDLGKNVHQNHFRNGRISTTRKSYKTSRWPVPGLVIYTWGDEVHV
jgi:hypothetical protein